MSPERAKALMARPERACLDAGEFEDMCRTVIREAKLREACEDYLKWVRTPHHHLPLDETVIQRWEILERMEAALEQKGGVS